MLVVQVLFWVSLAALVYIYVGYPLIVWLAGRISCQRKGRLKGDSTLELRCTPIQPLSVVIAGYNEAHRLTAKLDSLFASINADQIAEVLIGSDGSTDDTAAIVESYPDPRVRLIAFPQRRGKPAVLNDILPQCTSEIVVLTDARQPLAANALALLARRFANTRIGVVSGELMLRSSHHDSAAAEGVGVYWTYEKFIRKAESRFRSVPGATGALYAIRRELFRPVPANTLLDDVVIPMQAVEIGYRCVLETGAIAWDTPSQTAKQESIRKRRTIAGCAQLIVNQPRWLLPWCNPVWWEFVSHKLARLVSPLLMAMVLITNMLLISQTMYIGLLIAQIAFYASAVFGGLLERTGGGRWLGVSLMFLSLNATTVAALWDAARGRFRTAWQKTT